jgi:hypothetical protein
MADFDFNNFLSQLNTQGGGSSQIDFSSLLNQWQSNQGGSNNTGGTGGTGSTTGIPSYTGGGDVNKGISWFQDGPQDNLPTGPILPMMPSSRP